MPGQKSSGGFGLGGGKRRLFIAKTQEFLNHLRSYEFLGREDCEGQIEQALQDLERSTTIEESEEIMNEICLKVTLACYALKAYERVKRHTELESDDRQ